MPMRLRLAGCAVAFVAAAASSAYAADPIVQMPLPVDPAPVAYDWTGFYAGVNVGYGFGQIYDAPGIAWGPYNNVNGLVGGVQAGYNFQADSLVFGAEVDIQLSGMSETISNVAISLDYFGTARGRIGVAFDDVLPYLTGGLAYGGVSIDDGLVDRGFHVGWTVGGGVEYAVSEAMTIKGEYLYTDLGNFDYPSYGDASLRFHTVRFGANFRF